MKTDQGCDPTAKGNANGLLTGCPHVHVYLSMAIKPKQEGQT